MNFKKILFVAPMCMGLLSAGQSSLHFVTSDGLVLTERTATAAVIKNLKGHDKDRYRQSNSFAVRPDKELLLKELYKSDLSEPPLGATGQEAAGALRDERRVNNSVGGIEIFGSYESAFLTGCGSVDIFSPAERVVKVLKAIKIKYPEVLGRYLKSKAYTQHTGKARLDNLLEAENLFD
ncbi:hypothetical protein AGMMS49949_00850 [Alphaproteobacteria bacterium]|nr:hypothetical protein AGMMS49949_00850 [Alphaproteobacteria bacterium]GHS97094.1 hypothetical protein AGMMS50296_3780 [Alphaproteobacteria bacterium]